MGAEPSVFEEVMRRETLVRRLSVQPARSDELTADLESSRSTINRGLSTLQCAGLVERIDGRYQLTTTGTLTLAEFDRLVRQLETITVARDLLRSLPATPPVDPSLFVDATAVLGDQFRPSPTEGPPTRTDPLGVFRTLLETGTHLRGVAPKLNGEVVTAVQDAVPDRAEINEGIEVALAAPHDAVETLLTTFREPTAAALEDGWLALRETTAPLPYGLVVLEREGRDSSDDADLDVGCGPVTALVVCGETGIRGLLVTDNADALEWAREMLADVWVDSRPLSALEDT